MEGTPAAATRAYWLKTLHRWHWISSALALVGLLLFSLTGITLNHATDIEARPKIQAHTASLPPDLRPLLDEATATDRAPLPPALAQWAAVQFGIDAERPGAAAEWSEDEVYLSLPRAGGDAWLRIDRATGEAEAEITDRGWIAWFNDLHKGRHTGAVWFWFIDLLAFACLVFAVTGLLILKLHAAQRPATWPVTAAGLVLPALVALLFIH